MKNKIGVWKEQPAFWIIGAIFLFFLPVILSLCVLQIKGITKSEKKMVQKTGYELVTLNDADTGYVSQNDLCRIEDGIQEGTFRIYNPYNGRAYEIRRFDSIQTIMVDKIA